MSFHVIIPARLKSTRLPRKVLLEIGNKSMVQRVFEQASASQALTVTVATDDDEVYQHVKSFTDKVLMTKASHPTGTDRAAEVTELLELGDDEIVVNLQGDEPFMPPILLNQVALLLERHPHTVMATLCEHLTKLTDVFDPNLVKVVMNEKQEALYFSRAPIPWYRGAFQLDVSQMKPVDIENSPYYRHIGLYAYRVGFLKNYVQWPVAPVEEREQLEQLRVLMRGERIAIEVAKAQSPVGVDTEADLALARRIAAR